MNLFGHVAAPDTAAFLAHLIFLMRAQRAGEQIRQVIQTQFSNLGAFSFRPQTETVPASFCADFAGDMLCCVDGANQLGHAAGYAAGLNTETDFRLYGGLNTFLAGAGVVISQHVRDTVSTPRQQIRLAGHSMGGAICYAAARMLADWQTVGHPSVISFGAPRPGPSEFSETLSLSSICRWLNEGDAVADIPPRQSQSPLYFALLSPKGRLNVNRYVHPRGGVMLNSSGGTSPIDAPVESTVDVTLDVATWMVQATLSITNPHNISAYALRLNTLVSSTPGMCRIPDTPGSGV